MFVILFGLFDDTPLTSGLKLRANVKCDAGVVKLPQLKSYSLSATLSLRLVWRKYSLAHSDTFILFTIYFIYFFGKFDAERAHGSDLRCLEINSSPGSGQWVKLQTFKVAPWCLFVIPERFSCVLSAAQENGVRAPCKSSLTNLCLCGLSALTSSSEEGKRRRGNNLTGTEPSVKTLCQPFVHISRQ